MSRGKLVRWGVPMAAVAVIGAAIGAGPVIAAVSGDPVLPERSAQQLLAEAAARGAEGRTAPDVGDRPGDRLPRPSRPPADRVGRIPDRPAVRIP
ncbi:hypothetical protein [Nonomuraea dietziae]|uniref:hypothetical protein n=1 Tax=Nonomuraea dietziae TaxID=65515 RepID=UPI0031DB5669